MLIIWFLVGKLRERWVIINRRTGVQHRQSRIDTNPLDCLSWVGGGIGRCVRKDCTGSAHVLFGLDWTWFGLVRKRRYMMSVSLGDMLEL